MSGIKSTALLALTTLTSIVFLYNNCSQSTLEAGLSELASSPKNGGLNAPPSGTSGGAGVSDLALSSSLNPVMKLGEELNVPVTITSQKTSATVALAVSNASLLALSPNGDIEVSFTPTEVSLTPGSSVTANMKIITKTTAPSFDSRNIEVEAKTPGGVTLGKLGQVALKVEAIIEIKGYGNAASADQKWDRPATMNFRQHAGGLVVRVFNYDTRSSHIFHGNGSFPHSPTGSPIAAAAATGQPGGVYQFTVSANETRQGSYYYHDIGDSGARRLMNFNIDRAATLTAVPRGIASEDQAFSKAEDEALAATGNCHEVGWE